MNAQFPTAGELLSLAAFFVSGHQTEILLDPDCKMDAPQELRGWLSLHQVNQDYGAAPEVILAGLKAHARRGAIRMAHDASDQDRIYVELRRDVRQEPGYRPWSVRQGVRLLLEGRTPSPAPRALA